MLQNQGKMKKNSKKRKNCDATVGKRYPFATEIEKKNRLGKYMQSWTSPHHDGT